MLLGVLGTIFVSASVLVEIAGAAGLNVNPIFDLPIPNMVRSIGGLIFVFGMLFFGVSIIKYKTLPFWGGILLILGTIIFALGSVVTAFGPYFIVIGATLTGAGFVWLSLPILLKKAKVTENTAVL
jgi:hypothetical protein